MWACLEQKKHTSTKYKQSDLLITLNGTIKKNPVITKTHTGTRRKERRKNEKEPVLYEVCCGSNEAFSSLTRFIIRLLCPRAFIPKSSFSSVLSSAMRHSPSTRLSRKMSMNFPRSFWMSHCVTSSTLQLVRLAGLRGDIEGEGLDAAKEGGRRET